MDFNDTPEEAVFRADVRTWLASNAPAFVAPSDWSPGDERFAALGSSWHKCKFSAGYAALGLPKSLGGQGATAMQEVIFAQEESRFNVPIGPFISIGVNLAVPTINKHGTQAQIEKFSHKTLQGDITWCQMFSEPAAGSDLAGLRTKAVKDGDEWIVNGQKVWTSWAHTADWGILVARTDSEVAKHKGLTFFMVDMKTPGIEVRPIRQISGESEFNEVFLTDVRIPDENRLGNVGDGWKCVMTTLTNERMSIGGESLTLPTPFELLAQAEKAGANGQAYRKDIARFIAIHEGLENYRNRLITSISKGEQPSSMSSMSKYVFANLLQDVSAMASDIQGIDCVCPDDSDALTKKFQYGYLWASALRIAGGTDEILLNQIAERVLGLPGEIRVDKDIAFSKLPVGK